MTSTSPRPAAIRRSLRFIATVSLGAVLLVGASGQTAATSLVAVQAHGGPHGAIAALAGNDEVVMSRSVGLMEGARADPSATALGRGSIEVTRSVGLMEGAKS